MIFNDISARDVQLSKVQWLKGKSYRTFGPLDIFILNG
ncbi:fumarylacetoacetate hydrolase family protein [Neobacillus niacini]